MRAEFWGPGSWAGRERSMGPSVAGVGRRGICRACGSDVQNTSGFCHQELSCATECDPQQHRKGRESPAEARAHRQRPREATEGSDSAHLLTEGASRALPWSRPSEDSRDTKRTHMGTCPRGSHLAVVLASSGAQG